jgi:hypothetical protein
MPAQPFQVVESLGSCQVGTVWSAVDAQGTALTVAFLDPAAATDQRWRDAFANTAHALAQQQLRFVHADFAASPPWVAYVAAGGPGAERIFQALGLDYRPTRPRGSPWAPPAIPPEASQPEPEPMDPDVTVTQKLDADPAAPAIMPAEAAPGPVPADAAPAEAAPAEAVPAIVPAEVAPEPATDPVLSTAPVSPQPWSWPLRPITDEALPVSGAPRQAPDAAQSSGVPALQAGPQPETGLYFPEPGTRAPERRSRTGLWVAVVGLVVLLLAGGGAAVVALRGTSVDSSPTHVSTGSASSTLKAPAPTASPLSPGLEPPKPGSWPVQWPRFVDTDQVQTMTGLDGLGFTLKVPLSWQCVPAGRAQGFARYFCGVSPGANPQIGGELIVRDCPKPCGEDKQVAMRKAEEAWGLQWVRTGKFSTYAESSSLQVDGAQRYGLVVVAYWRGGADGAIDHELVLRMVAPADGAGQLRRVANYLRETLIF